MSAANNVDLFGEPTAPTHTAPKAKPKTRRVSDPAAADAFHGYEVIGYSPEMIAKARRACEHKGLPWNEMSFMRKTKPAKVCPHPYQLQQAAQACAAMATAAGWKNVFVEEILRSAV